jgi:hypothetical protein
MMKAGIAKFNARFNDGDDCSIHAIALNHGLPQTNMSSSLPGGFFFFSVSDRAICWVGLSGRWFRRATGSVGREN